MVALQQTYRHLISSLYVCLLSLLYAPIFAFGQSSNDTIPTDTQSIANNSINLSIDTTISDTSANRALLPDQVNIFFTEARVELKKGEAISNVLEIINNTSEKQTFIVDLLYPGAWINLTENNPITLEPMETRFLPIILLPNRILNNNTEIMINTFLINREGDQLAGSYFTLYTVKKVSWKTHINNGQRLYFRNGETTKDIEFSIMNTGNFEQDIMVTTKVSNGFMVLQDTNNNILNKKVIHLHLPSMHDTTITYRAKVLDYKNRNFKKVSLLYHNPTVSQEYRKYSIFINTSEPKGLGKNVYKRGSKVDIVKLPNSVKVSPYGYPNLPLTVESNIQNVLSDYTFMTVNMRGFKQLNKEANLAYFAQINYSKTYWNTQLLRSVPWYIGYYDRKTTVELGQVNGNMLGIYNFGQGIKLSHTYLKRHKTSAFYVRDPGIFQPARSESFGLGHEFTISDNFKIDGRIGRGMNHFTKTIVDVASLNPSFGINNRHFISLTGGISNRIQQISGLPSTEVQGFLVGLNFSTYYFNKNVKTNVGGRYNDPYFSYGRFERLTASHRTSIRINENQDLFINNNYQNMRSLITAGGSQPFAQELLFNNIVFSLPTRFGTFQPGIYYDITNFLNNNIHSRGLSMRFSDFDFNTNFLSSFFFKAGYNDPINYPNTADFFTFEMATILRYRVWNFSARYNYGAQSTNALLNMQREGITPQSFRISIQHQYQFRNPHFITENVLIYNYNNRFNGHNVGFYPQFYYYTDSGWRFGLQGFYNFASSNYSSIYDTYNTGIRNFENIGPTTNNNLNLAVNVKKDFGIPVPFIKKRHATNNIIAFYDVNGNNVKDKDEPILENVIIRIGTTELITNKEGIAVLANVPIGKYPFSVIALDKMMGWFPDINDSISILNNGQLYIPFVRGVKVFGDVTLDRQRIAVDNQDKVEDLSRIKITAVGQKVYTTLTDIDGHFEFYLPNGSYVITMDESILDQSYKLTKNNIPITLKTSQDGVYVSFYIVEKRRKVRFKTFD